MTRADKNDPYGTWTGVYQRTVSELATDQTSPTWLRIWLETLGHQRANGHAPWQPGDLARRVGKVDADGVLKPEKNIGREIQRAVQKGFLDPRSTPRCTIMRRDLARPPHGDGDAKCSVHDRRR